MATVRPGKAMQKSEIKSTSQTSERDVFSDQSPCNMRSSNTLEDDSSLGSNSLDSCDSYSQRPVAVVNPFHSGSQDPEVNCSLLSCMCYCLLTFGVQKHNSRHFVVLVFSLESSEKKSIDEPVSRLLLCLCYISNILTHFRINLGVSNIPYMYRQM